MTRDPLPQLEFSTPLCPLCETETRFEPGVGFLCDDCNAAWNEDGAFDEFTDSAEQCPETRVNEWTGRTFRCQLAAGHTGDPLLHMNAAVLPWRQGGAS